MFAEVSGRRRSSDGASASLMVLTCPRRRSSRMETNLRSDMHAHATIEYMIKKSKTALKE
eukprot:485015-Prymnesium_polylepis.2